MHYVAENVFLAMNERSGRVGGRLTFQLRLQYVRLGVRAASSLLW